jgi:hypothetical protein
MKRILHTLSACCLFMAVLIGGCGVLSARDHRLLRHVRRPSDDEMRVVGVASCDGAIWLSSSVYFRRVGTVFSAPAGWFFGLSGFTLDGVPWARPYYFHHKGDGYDQRSLILPHWLVATLFLLPGVPFILVCRTYLRARRRLKRRQCPGCGYDVRFSAERCPECGNSISIPPGIFKGSFSDGKGK